MHVCTHAFITQKPPFTNTPPTNPPVHSRNSAGLSFALSPTALHFSPSSFFCQLSSPNPPPHTHTHLNTHLIFPGPPFHFIALFFSLSVWNSRLFIWCLCYFLFFFFCWNEMSSDSLIFCHPLLYFAFLSFSFCLVWNKVSPSVLLYKH